MGRNHHRDGVMKIHDTPTPTESALNSQGGPPILQMENLNRRWLSSPQGTDQAMEPRHEARQE